MPQDTTRRRFIEGAAVVSAVALAGCTGGDSGSETTEDPMATTDSSMGTETMGTTAERTSDEDEMGTTSGMDASATFTVRVENVSTDQTLQTMDGAKSVPLSPTAYAVHEGENPLFSPGEAASDPLESLAEDGVAGALADAAAMDAVTAGAVRVPEGADEAGPIGPGGAYEFTVEAQPGHRLSLATMFVESNDLFYAPGEDGVALFADGDPVEGSVTDSLSLWDAGTEENQPPGTGGDQAPRQMEAGAGPMEDATVRTVASVDDGHDYPATGDVIEVTVTPQSMEG